MRELEKSTQSNGSIDREGELYEQEQTESRENINASETVTMASSTEQTMEMTSLGNNELNNFWNKYEKKNRGTEETTLNKKELISGLINVEINDEESDEIGIVKIGNAIEIYVGPGNNRKLFEKLAMKNKGNINERVLSTTKRNKNGLHCIIVDKGHKALREKERYSFEEILKHEREHVNFYFRNEEIEKKLTKNKRDNPMEYALHRVQDEILASLKNHEGTLSFSYKFDKGSKGFGAYDYIKDLNLDEQGEEEYYKVINSAIESFNNLMDMNSCSKEEAIRFFTKEYVPLSDWTKNVKNLLGDNNKEESELKNKKTEIINEIKKQAIKNQELWEIVSGGQLKSKKYQKVKEWYENYIKSLNSDSRFMQGNLEQLRKEKETLERVGSGYDLMTETIIHHSPNRASVEVKRLRKIKKPGEVEDLHKTRIRSSPLEKGVTAGEMTGAVFGEEFKDEASRLWTKKFWIEDAPNNFKDWWNEKATWKFWQWIYSDRAERIKSKDSQKRAVARNPDVKNDKKISK